MNEYLCPFDFLQFGLLLAVHASILLMNADWSGMDLRLITTRDLLMASEAEAESETLSFRGLSVKVNCYILYVYR